MFCNPKYKLLDKQEKKPSFENENEIISINLKWSSPNILVRLVPIPAAKKKAGGQDEPIEKKITEEISKDRGAMIDGAIVKIMKTNKDVAVSHQMLVQKVMEMISLFKPQPPQIKVRIESLIM